MIAAGSLHGARGLRIAPGPNLPRELVNDTGNIRVIERDGTTIWLVGTAHVSHESVAEVQRVIDEVDPDTVCIELCEPRYQALTDESRWQNLDVFKVLREGKTLFLLANLAVGAYQRRLGAKLGIKPGAELLAAAEAAEARGARVELVDRDIHITLKRAWANVPFLRRMSLLAAIGESLFTRDDVEEVDIEQLKDQANLADMMAEFSRALPEVKEPLIDERDVYMVSRIREAPGERIVAVVGAGHVPGMVARFDEEIDREAITVIPSPKWWVGLLKWIIPAVVLAAFYWGWQKNQGQTLEAMIWAWALPNMIAAGLLTAIAGGKPLSILVAFIGSPITSLNPLINTGMTTGLVEAWQRKPTVQDAERINDDVQSWRGFYRNPFTRVLLVAVAATLGSALGAWIGGAWVLTLLGKA